MSAAGICFSDMVKSLTGYEEYAIARHFNGLNPYTQGADRPNESARALVFVTRKRQGDDDLKAKDFALAMPMGDVDDYFDPEEKEVMPEDPATDSGKGDSQPG
jgi:hypothetical protein